MANLVDNPSYRVLAIKRRNDDTHCRLSINYSVRTGSPLRIRPSALHRLESSPTGRATWTGSGVLGASELAVHVAASDVRTHYASQSVTAGNNPAERSH